MKVNTLLYYCIIGLLIIACSEHTVQPPAELANGRVTGTVHGLIYDNTTQSLFGSGDVTVTWVVDGATESTVTDSLGYYIITDLPPGDYTIHFIHSSVYAVGQIVVHVPTLEEILYSTGSFGSPPPTDKDYDHTISQDITLYKKNAGIQGTVYKKESDQLTSPAAGVTVIADHDTDDHDSYNIHPDSYSTVTNSSGFFSFDSLPSTPDVNIVTLPYNDGTNEYACYERTEILCRNQTRTMDDIILTINSPEPFISQNNFFNVHNFPLTDNLTCTFSKTMHASSFKYSLYHGGTHVECDTTWSHNISLTIDPGVDLLPNTNYTLTLYGESTDEHNFYLDTMFTTQNGIEFISTNLERIEGLYDKFPVDQDIILSFSMEVNINHPDLMLYIEDSDNNPIYLNTPSLSSDSKTITLSHPNTLEPEQEYTLSYDVYSTILGDHVSDIITFTTASSDQVPGQVTGFSLISPSSNNIDWNTTSMTFRWNTLESADWYAIFAEDNYNNSDRIFIDGVDDIDYMTRQTMSITLPSEFDYYEGDVIQTPFLNGTEVTFYIAAGNDAGMGQLKSISTTDNLNPDLELNYHHGGPIDNSGNSTAANIYLEFTSTTGEYLNPSTLNVTTSDDSLTYMSVNWYSEHNDKNAGMIRISISPEYDATNETITIKCEDTSGNEGSDDEDL